MRIAPLLCVTALPVTGCRMPAAVSTVPSSWLGTPDQSGDASTALSPAEEARIGSAFDQVLGVHHEVLEGLAEPALNPSSACAEPWHLGGYMTSFAVTVSGILGSLAGAGTAAAEAHWLPAGQHASALDTRAGNRIAIRESSTPLQLERQLEPSIQGALGSGLIRNAPRFRTHLLEIARRFQSMARALDGLQLRGRRWQVQAFRIEIQFNANGDILPIVAVGSSVNFRFDWEKKTPARGESAPLSADELADPAASRVAERVRAFAAAVSEELDVLDTSADTIESHGMKLAEVRVSSGITVQGDVGFAQASTQVYGSINFKPDESAPVVNSFLAREGSEGEPLLLIADPSALQAYRSAGLAIDADTVDQGGTPRALVRIKRRTFRKGLMRASRIGAFFARRAASLRVGRWGIGELMTSFDMSLSGSLGVATVGGLGLVELNYENPGL